MDIIGLLRDTYICFSLNNFSFHFRYSIIFTIKLSFSTSNHSTSVVTIATNANLSISKGMAKSIVVSFSVHDFHFLASYFFYPSCFFLHNVKTLDQKTLHLNNFVT